MNINQLMKEAKKMQADMEKSQTELANKEFDASVGGGATLGHLGLKILENFVSKLEDVCVVEKAAKQEGRNMTMVLAPKKA